MRRFLSTLGQTLARNPVSTFSALCVAGIAVWLGFLSHRLLAVVSSPGWCKEAIDAERISPGITYVGLTTCVEMLKIQLEGAVNAFYIALSSYSFSLIVLVVVFLAGARANFKLGKEGITADMSRDPQANMDAAAEHVVEGAQEAAAEVKGGA